MDTTIQLECASGVIVLSDPARRSAMSPELRYWVEAFADPDGKSQLRCDFDEPWEAVWARAAREVRESMPQGHFAVVKAVRGRFAIRVQDHALTESQRECVRDSSKAYATITTGTLEFSDLGASAQDAVSVSSPAGVYELRVHCLRLPEGRPQVVGIFGDDQAPAVIVVLSAISTAPNDFSLVRCDATAWPTHAAAGRRCHAEVKSVENAIAILRLRVSTRIWSGYGRLKMPAELRLQPGMPLLVQLVEHTGSFWWCTLPEATAETQPGGLNE